MNAKQESLTRLLDRLRVTPRVRSQYGERFRILLRSLPDDGRTS